MKSARAPWGDAAAPLPQNPFLPSPVIAVEPFNSVSIIRLDRAHKRNALTVSMLAGLRQALDNSMSARAIVLSGVGEAFCAGFDLTACRDDDTVLPALLSGLSAVARTLREHPAPVVVSAHGAALAGGCALLAAADFAVTTSSARIGYPVVRLGVSPAVSAPLLGLAIGNGHARERLLDPGVIDGLQALRIGLVSECVQTTAECEARAIALASHLADKPRHALAYTKRWLNQLDGSSDSTLLDAGLHASLRIVGSPEQRELLPQAWTAKP